MILLKNKTDIFKLDYINKLNAELLLMIYEYIKQGIYTVELEDIVIKFCEKCKVNSTFKDYSGFPNCLSISINDEIIHGLPGDVILKENDLVSIDCGLDKDGFFSDAAFTKYISKSINDIKYRLLKVTEEALLEGIKIATCGNRIQDIGYTIQTMAVNNGFGVLKRFVGHGTGFNLHEDPKIFNYVDEYNINWRLRPGMVIAIEPILVEDSCEIYIDKNGWTAKTLDGGMSAHFEHTIAITEDGSIILSKL